MKSVRERFSMAHSRAHPPPGSVAASRIVTRSDSVPGRPTGCSFHEAAPEHSNVRIGSRRLLVAPQAGGSVQTGLVLLTGGEVADEAVNAAGD